MYVITGATGNTGKLIANALLDAGKDVRIISRDAAKAQDLIDKGAVHFAGSTNDLDFLKRAFDGAEAVYALIPSNFAAEDHTADQATHSNAMAEAVKYCKVPFAVTLSSQGAHLESGAGVVHGLYEMEQRFDAIPGINVLHLRPTFFAENVLGMIGLIKQAGIMGSPLKPTLKFPVIATKDIAAYASGRLLKLDFKGLNTQDLLGERDVTYPEMASVFGAAIGKPDLSYVEFSYDDMKKAMMEQGASESIVDNYVQFTKTFNSGKMTETAVRNEESTTPTSIEDFAETFAYVHNLD